MCHKSDFYLTENKQDRKMLSFGLGGKIVGGQSFYAALTVSFQPPSRGCNKDSGAQVVELIEVVVT